MAEAIIICHQGMPCTPPVVDGITFVPLGEDDVWVGECSEEQASSFTRNPAYTRFGGGRPFPATGDAATDAKTEESAQTEVPVEIPADAPAEAVVEGAPVETDPAPAKKSK